MTVRLTIAKLSVAASLAVPFALSGCSNESATPEAQTAEQATGINPKTETKKSVQTTRDVLVEKETKVVDKNTGQVLSDTKETTPVKITEQKVEKTEVKVNVGDTKTSGHPTK